MASGNTTILNMISTQNMSVTSALMSNTVTTKQPIRITDTTVFGTDEITTAAVIGSSSDGATDTPITSFILATTSEFSNSTVAMTTDYETKGSFDFESLLQNENDREAKALTPVTVYLIILMIIGVFGNLLVLYVYKFRFKRSTSRVFILSLAAFDLLTCLLGMPYHIIDMTYPLTFVWNELCKTLSYALTFTIVASIFVLDLIAIDRYRKICIPMEKQLSASGTKITCWVTVMISAVFAVPIIFIYGSVEVGTMIPNVTGKECYISSDLSDSDLPMVYDVLNILIFLVSVCILTVLYIKVGTVICKRKHFHESMRSESQRSESGTSTPNTSVIQMNSVTEHGTPPSVRFNKGKKDSAVQLFSTKSSICKTPSGASARSYNSPKITRKEDKLHRKRLKRLMSELSGDEEGTLERGPGKRFNSKKQMRTMRITSMLFIITLIFVISFLPYLIIQILNGMDENFWNEMSMTELVLINFLMRTYFINNMINPIIYWFLDKKFRQEVRKFFREVRKCHWSKTFNLDQKSFTS